MIFSAVDIIRQELNNALAGKNIHVELGNISEILGDPNANSDDTAIVISLINIEENRISRDPHNYIRKGNGIVIKNPAVHLYLSLLFTAIKQTSKHFNDQALQDLEQVIGFFQTKYVFDHSNEPIKNEILFHLVWGHIPNSKDDLSWRHFLDCRTSFRNRSGR